MRGLSFGELLDYSAEESNHWRDFFKQHPDALDLPCDIAGTKTVREVVFHIVAVQMRYAERLLNMPVTEFETLAAKIAQGKPGEELFALSRKSFEDLRSFAIAAKMTGTAHLRFPRARPASSPPAVARSLFMRCFTASGTGRSYRLICGRKATSRTGCMISLRLG